MPYVSSSAITSIEYNEFTRELYVTFTGARTYTYYGVPRDVYERFVGASSKGQFFNTHIKDQYG